MCGFLCCSDRRVTSIHVSCSAEYFAGEDIKEEEWYGKADLFAFDPPWGVNPGQTGPGQPDELLPNPKIKALAGGLYGAGSLRAICLARITLAMYMDWHRAFVGEGWLVQQIPKLSYKGAPFQQRRNTGKGKLSGQL